MNRADFFLIGCSVGGLVMFGLLALVGGLR
jgi:hypothetical protein